MIIDWFTVIAQALNFLVLLLMMKHFLYKPILKAIDDREKRIALALADAEAKKAEAQQEKNDFQHKNEDFDRQRSTLFEKASNEAKTEGRRLLTEARQAADAYHAKRQETLLREQQRLHDEITRRTCEEVFAIARKTLSDLADVHLEERMSKVFRHRLQELDEEKKESLVKAFKTSTGPVFVRSAFLLSPGQQEEIRQELNNTFSAEINVQFETTPVVIGGIELAANGRKVAWSIKEYLESLEKSITELLQNQTKPDVKPAKTEDTETELESTQEPGIIPPATRKEVK